MNEQELSEFRMLLSGSHLTSAQIRLILCEGRFPLVLAILQSKAGVRGKVPTAREVGAALRQIATETKLIDGRRGGRDKNARWGMSSVAEKTAARHVSQPSGNPGQFAESVACRAQHDEKEHFDQGSKDGLFGKVSSVNGQARGEANPRSDPSLHVPAAPKGYHLRGVSTLVDGEGVVSQQWIKTTVDRDAVNLELLLEAIKTLPDSFRDAHIPIKPSVNTMADLLVTYPIGDPHVGLFAWAEETGNNYDVRIAERIHVQAIEHLVAGVPASKQALILPLGDMLHCDSNLARTERSGNPLDVDSRFAKVLRVGVRMLIAMVDAALRKHETVFLVIETGNHDPQASAMLTLALDMYYQRDERVHVDLSPARFHYHRFGKNLFGTTHGSDTKAEDLPMIMARDRAPDWGQTTHRKWFVGHFHQKRAQEFPGCEVEYYRTLAGRDAWAHGKGYRSDRGMAAEIYHREHGFIGSGYVPLSLLEVGRSSWA